ncbi:MAG: glycoside hydrolase family 13 protein [Streptococcaceae bacterium]|jgi:pullulanase|nr:glycoside hydrolase family 13 protein [Streptococcaceae bacterium]
MYQFNPWLETYKRPFGAVPNFSTVTFNFKAPADTNVTLIIHRDFGARHEFSLAQKVDASSVSADSLHETTVEFDHGRALYFYHFEIREAHDWGAKRLFYGASEIGGEGRLVDNETEVKEFQLTVYEGDDTSPDWYKNAIFYQIFPDRFANGNENHLINHPKQNSFLYGTEADEPYYIKDAAGDIVRWDFYGGNLRGIIQKIPYLKELGVTALYLNPIFLARSNHRYDTSDYLQIDPMLGTLDDFKELIAGLHAENMRLILDGVFSHVGWDSQYFNSFGNFGDNVGAAKDKSSPYYSWFKFTNWPTDYKAWWGIKDLPEVDKYNPDFRAYIYAGENSVINTWTRLGVDGWRLDVADELPDDFIRGIRETLDKYDDKVLIGEVWEDASNKISYEHRRDYIQGASLTGVMNYPFRDLTIAYLGGHISAEKICSMLTHLKENYPRAIWEGNLNNMGTHDTERILSMVGDENLPLAVGLHFMYPGVPTIYYGDEAGLVGLKDPSNRKFFPWNMIHEETYALYKNWTTKRLSNLALRHGEAIFGFVENVLVLVRADRGQQAIYLVNPSEHAVSVSLENVQMSQLTEFDTQIKALGSLELAAHGSYFATL